MKEGVERMKEEVDQRGGSDREPGKASEDGVPASPMLSNVSVVLRTLLVSCIHST